MLMCRGIRGATTAAENTDTAIYDSTRELLSQMIETNQMVQGNVAAAYFTVTPDLNAAYPAAAARQLGWTSTALMCSTEIPVPGSMERCIRIMVLYNTEMSQQEIVNIYLNGTDTLRLQGVQSA